MNIDTKNVELDFKNLIKCALNCKISWPVLKIVLENATSTLKESKKLNSVLLEELESLQSKQNKNEKQDERRPMIEPESLVAMALSPDIVQNCEIDEDITKKPEVGESEIDADIESIIDEEEGIYLTSNADVFDLEETSTQIESLGSLAQIQSDVERRIETENSKMDDIQAGRNHSAATDYIAIPTHDYTGSCNDFTEQDEQNTMQCPGFNFFCIV